MNIAINTRHLINRKLEGVPRYIYETTRRLVKLNPQHKFHFLFDRPFIQDFIFEKNVTGHVLRPTTRHPILWYYWFEKKLPQFFKKEKIELFISGDMYLSLNTNLPTILVSHDLAFHHFPEHLPKSHAWYYNHFSRKYHHRADKIIAVSQATKNDIIASYQVEEHKITVAPNSAPSGFKPVSESTKMQTQNKFTDGAPYFIYLGSVHPRKNVDQLMIAFDQYKSKTNNNIKLLIVGRMAWKNSRLQNTLQNLRHKSSIIFVKEFITDVNDVLASAEALCYVSKFEGFGIPILEAFCAGVPVITSNISSMPEVAGNAALLVDPNNTESIANAMLKISSDQMLRDQLIKKGNQQKLKYNWDRTAQIISQEMNTLAATKK